jgi:hypothetical protein
MAKERKAGRRLKAQRWALGGGKAHVEGAALAERHTLKSQRWLQGAR